CNMGRPGWDQKWRGPLRAALDWLRDMLAPRFQDAAARLLRDPWAARDAYIDVVLDRSPESVARFFDQQAARSLTDDERIKARKLLEVQRNALLMYTSCAWFFDEISGIETTQVLAYAGRALQLAEELFGDSLEPEFLKRLEAAPSNIAPYKNGRVIYERFVAPLRTGWDRIAAHYAVSSLFETYPKQTGLFCFQAEQED